MKEEDKILNDAQLEETKRDKIITAALSHREIWQNNIRIVCFMFSTSTVTSIPDKIIYNERFSQILTIK